MDHVEELIVLLTRAGFDKCTPSEEGGVIVGCSQCEALVINGIATHETSCINYGRDLSDD